MASCKIARTLVEWDDNTEAWVVAFASHRPDEQFWIGSNWAALRQECSVADLVGLVKDVFVPAVHKWRGQKVTTYPKGLRAVVIFDDRAALGLLRFFESQAEPLLRSLADAAGRLVFENNEQFAFGFAKALLFGDVESAREAMNTPDPSAVKALGRKVEGFVEEMWNEVAREVCYFGAIRKFSQNKEAGDVLLFTGQARLVEAASWDKIWGIGLSARDPDFAYKKRWKGTNWLGETLERVRAELIRVNVTTHS